MYTFNGLVIECVDSMAWPLNVHIQYEAALNVYIQQSKSLNVYMNLTNQISS